MLHLAVPDKNGKFLRQTLEEACEVVKLYRILSIPVMDTSTQCQRPVLLQTSMRMSLPSGVQDQIKQLSDISTLRLIKFTTFMFIFLFMYDIFADFAPLLYFL